VLQVNQRARFIGFRDPGIDLIRDHPGLYIAQLTDDNRALLASTPAVIEPIARVDTVFRGVVMKNYQIDRISHWTPDLNPLPDTPFYRWPNLAMGAQSYQVALR
jgi:hypothetical protein